MRIVSGSARGRKLKEPVGSAIRPTSDYVKESVFNILAFDIEGRRVLDLFSGSGQIGIEALSRGAKSAVFVDSSKQSVKLIYENLERCGFSELAQVHVADAIRFLRSDEKFDIIYIDPPYESDLAGKCLSAIVEFDKLSMNGIILAETKRDMVLPELTMPYELVKEYTYGGVKLTKYTRLPHSE